MKQILLIDDDLDFRQMLKLSLEKARYEVTVASDGRIGCQILEKRPHPIVITDIFMPEKEGLEVITEIKEKLPGIKIIAISGGGRLASSFRSDEALRMAKDLGADRVIAKPFKLENLLMTVKELLSDPSP